MGRFLSPDRSGGDPDPVPYADFNNPQSLNLYSYAYNNPLTNMDADGHDPCDSQTATSTDSGDASRGITTDVSVSAAPCNSGPATSFSDTLFQFAKNTVNVVSQAVHQVANIMTTPGGPGCMANLTGSGAAGAP